MFSVLLKARVMTQCESRKPGMASNWGGPLPHMALFLLGVKKKSHSFPSVLKESEVLLWKISNNPSKERK